MSDLFQNITENMSESEDELNKSQDLDFLLRTTKKLPGMTGPPNSFTARGPVTLTAILFTQPAV